MYCLLLWPSLLQPREEWTSVGSGQIETVLADRLAQMAAMRRLASDASKAQNYATDPLRPMGSVLAKAKGGGGGGGGGSARKPSPYGGSTDYSFPSPRTAATGATTANTALEQQKGPNSARTASTARVSFDGDRVSAQRASGECARPICAEVLCTRSGCQ